MVELSEPIREPGSYNINLRLHQNVAAEITVVAQAEGQEDYEADDPEGEEQPSAETEAA